MLTIGNDEPSLLYWGKTILRKVYLGYLLLWPKIKSCFGNGYWASDQPWDNEDKWVN